MEASGSMDGMRVRNPRVQSALNRSFGGALLIRLAHAARCKGGGFYGTIPDVWLQGELSSQHRGCFICEAFCLLPSSSQVIPCSKRYRHDWSVCPFAHNGEMAARRDPRLYQPMFCYHSKQVGAWPAGALSGRGNSLGGA
jgi:hypothetical protein